MVQHSVADSDRPTDQAASTIEDTLSTCDGQQLYPTKVDNLVVPTGKYCKPDTTSLLQPLKVKK